ncbi:glycoside hydrolase family 78 protein [Flavihumibacter sp. CACIAM 22H1]|uniref:glycoside hydrolase family 78 protein n=1 Tax=Flavihumibacter sp. CACIAM 22H1 TaxID=1812911 RepID=UPI0007A8B070|nr:glycoside hydrolase family 78 protein [Flavihumibacter sp. CACIAM 22H1]KYP15441.1 MAG: alpha-L-rhamnosidase [Flavihumibacter sp. CACIAM 22H1]
MIARIYCSLLLLFSSYIVFSQISPAGLQTEGLINPLGIDHPQPRFSWQLNSPKRGVVQTAYEIEVRSSSPKGKTVWQSGKQLSDSSVLVAYKGLPLESGQDYFWRVRVWDQQQKAGSWSNWAFWHTGAFQQDFWKASWIGVQTEEESRPSPVLRRPFSLGKKKIKSAYAYITSLGMYEAQLNGRKIGDAFLTPGWTSYDKRLQYQVYEVSTLLKAGENVAGVSLGNGWYRSYIGFAGQKDFYGKELALLFQLKITYTDGSTDLIVSDENWKSSTAEIRSSEIYHGETIDANKMKPGWASPGYNAQDWKAVKRMPAYAKSLVATQNEPIRKREVLKPVKFITTPKGEKVLDFGQNMVGWVKVTLHGNKGDTVTLSHAEVLDKFGNFYTENLRSAKQQDQFILSGKGDEVFEPHFTFQGFRYIKIDGLKTDPDPADYTAYVLYSDMEKTGEFETSNPLINQLQKNIQWGQRGNFLDVPTDCPQRDERLGWTGDAQAFYRTATFNFGVRSFFSKWLKDLALDQQANGAVPFVVPNVLGDGAVASTGWADAATIIPWQQWIVYGDKRTLSEQYPSMQGWIGYMLRNSKEYLWNTGFHFGDWLFYRPDDDTDGRAAITDKYLIAQCFFAYSTQLAMQAAEVLGKTDDVARYSALLADIKKAFLKEYVTPGGRLVSSSQTAYVLALQFDMLPESMRLSAADRLAANVKSYDTHLTTGFIGAPYLCKVLSKFGQEELAYALLLQETYPSWLYPVKMGATTIWERWDGQKPDSSFQNAGMNSFNHYAYGAIGEWMYQHIAGIQADPAHPGFKSVIIRPSPGGGLTYAKASLLTAYGRLESGWKKEGDGMVLELTIPANTSATVYFKTSNAENIRENGQPVLGKNGFEPGKPDQGYIPLRIGSGKYRFECRN